MSTGGWVAYMLSLCPLCHPFPSVYQDSTQPQPTLAIPHVSHPIPHPPTTKVLLPPGEAPQGPPASGKGQPTVGAFIDRGCLFRVVWLVGLLMFSSSPSHVQVTTDAITHALTSPYPKTRYGCNAMQHAPYHIDPVDRPIFTHHPSMTTHAQVHRRQRERPAGLGAGLARMGLPGPRGGRDHEALQLNSGVSGWVELDVCTTAACGLRSVRTRVCKI